MGDEVEKTCPLCAEEMDLTDQQLKPCKCGYEICVWCWHHIMDMAERENTEGRCPACRKPYDKEKIVGMTANCERLVAEINSEKKLKSQKLKSKTHEGRKHLSSVRVIQRNLVYVIGIPSNLADEDFLQRKEYFGQYGKVLKVAISRTAGGTIQHSSNNTCSVYITYSKEEEAVRCIQSVHDYILEGQSLRACFGTTKYCHAWLRNTPCTNPDCLYLHDIGTPEDSFTKDDIVSAYTRSRIPQINGAANNLHRQSGNVLPPPVDDICNSGTSSGKPTVRSAFNNVVSQEKGSSPHGNSRRSITLPAGASWGLCATNGRPPTAPPACSDEPAKQNPDALSEQTDVVHPNGGLGVPEQYSDGDGCTIMINESKDVVQDAASSTVNVVNQLSGLPASEDIDDGIKFLSKPTNSIEIDRQSHNSTSEKNGVVLMNGNIQNLCTGLSSLHMDSHVFVPSNANDCNDPTINHYLSGSPRNQVLEQSHPQCASEPFSSLERRTTALDDACISRESPEWVLEPQMQGSKGEMGEDFLTLGERNLKVSEISHDPLHLSQTSNSFRMGNHSGGFSLQYNNAYALSNPGCHDLLLADREIDGPLLPFTSSNSLLTYGDGENKISNHSELDKISEHFNAFSRVEKDKCLGKLNEDSAAFEGHTGTDMGESTIISDILSLDFDSWDESLASPHNLAKILSENDRKHGSLKLSGSWKMQNSDQSRFSFARQENFVNQGNDFNLSSNVGIMNKYHFHQDYVQNGDVVFNNPQNGFFPNISEGYDIFPSSNSVFSSNKLSVSRGQISAPPGFSVPVRAPPPGFLATERMDESFSVNQLLERSLFRNQYQMQLNGDQDAGNDVELIDPAILAVGRGRVLSEMNNSSFDMRSTFNSQLSASENERRLQLLMQQSISGQQNHRYFKNIGDMFSPLTDPYNADSRFMEQSPFAQLSLQSRNLHNSNGWDGCHEIQRGNNLVMAELLRNEGFALNKNFPGYEGLKFQMSGSGSLYNREFGM